MLQTKLGSLYEAIMNILIGYCVATLGNYLILPFFLEGVTLGNSLEIGLWFTALSLARQYAIRRWFNARLHRAAMALAGGWDEGTPLQEKKMTEISDFMKMLRELRRCNNLTLEAMGDSLGYSASYLSDLERGNWQPSVKVINRICEWSGRGPIGRYIWHRAGAIANGWEI